MKKIINLLYGTLALLAITIVFAACKSNQVSCESCTMKEPNKVLGINLGEERNIEIKVWDEDNNYHFASSRSLSDEEINYVIHSFLGQPVEQGAIDVAVVLFTSKAYDSKGSNNVLKEDIEGYSLYFGKENRFRHRFFLKGDDDVFRIVPELNCETRSISANNLFSIAGIYFNDRFEDVSVIEMTNLPRYSIIMENKQYRNNTLGSSIKYLERKHQKALIQNGSTAARPKNDKCKAPRSA